MSETNRIGSRGGHTYTEAHRRAYLNIRDRELARAKDYYIANAERIKTQRLARYYAQKKLKLLATQTVS